MKNNTTKIITIIGILLLAFVITNIATYLMNIWHIHPILSPCIIFIILFLLALWVRKKYQLAAGILLFFGFAHLVLKLLTYITA